MDRKISFYGTPLNKILTNDADKAGSYGPISNRRARLNKQQTVRDAQGRQRFHGAFTGGFSAGYYNTVDSVEGFQPRQFISTRQHRHVGGHIHKPEDYMDDEDFGEFGIAPKKLRIISQQNCSLNLATKIDSASVISCVKNDYHGLGYKGLKDRGPAKLDLIQNKNSLEAKLGEGKRLAISGEAFGQGVLENQDDLVDSTQLYGYERIQDFVSSAPKPSSSRHKLPEFADEGEFKFDKGYIKGFIPAKNMAATDCDNVLEKYPLPVIESDWVMPTRKIPTLPATSLSQDNEKLESPGHSASLFSRKFTVASHHLHDSEEVAFKSGLVPYSDLRATYPKLNQNKDPPIPQGEQVKAVILRELLEWRPCSLLCKRFNVPNPFPDNSFVGVRSTQEELPDKQYVCKSTGVESAETDVNQGHALLDLKKSIFNVDLSTSQLQLDNDQETNSEDEPQVLEVGNETMHDVEKIDNVPLDEDPDIIVVSAPRLPEPEVITLSSSSSSPTPSGETKSVEEIEESDIYGPPIPPNMKALIDLDSRQSRIRHESSKRKRRKNKKHKRHKRRQTPNDD